MDISRDYDVVENCVRIEKFGVENCGIEICGQYGIENRVKENCMCGDPSSSRVFITSSAHSS